MNRNEVFSALNVASVGMRLGWASLEVVVDDTQDVQLLVSGNDEDVNGLRISCVNGAMEVEQPAYGLSANLNGRHWMEIVLRLPQSWKGAVDLSATTGPISARGITGTDLSVGTVSGDITAAHLQGITCVLQTIAGKLNAADVHCDQLQLRSVSSAIRMEGGSFSQGKVNNITGEINLSLEQPFDLLEVNTVAANVMLEAPLDAVKLRHKTISGHVRSVGVSLCDTGVPMNVNSVSGDVEIVSTDQE